MYFRYVFQTDESITALSLYLHQGRISRLWLKWIKYRVHHVGNIDDLLVIYRNIKVVWYRLCLPHNSQYTTASYWFSQVGNSLLIYFRPNSQNSQKWSYTVCVYKYIDNTLLSSVRNVTSLHNPITIIDYA